MLILKLLALYLVLAGLLFLVSRFLHGYLYTEIPGTLYWRAPAAAAVVWLSTVVLAQLVNSDGKVHWPAAFNELFLFSTGRTEVEFVAFEVPEGGERVTRYAKRGGGQYKDDSTGKPLPRRTMVLDGILEDGSRTRFTILKDKEGYIDESRGVRYTDDQGRIMAEEELGRITSTSYGQFWWNMLVLVITFGVWFACWWLLLLFHWTNALALAVPSLFAWALALNFVS